MISLWYTSANIRLDEDVLKTSFIFVFRRCLQDVLIETNIFTLLIRLQKTSSRRIQDVMIKTNIFVLVIRLQDVLLRCLQNVFKTSSRRLVTTSSRHLQEVFMTSWRRLQDVFKTSPRRLQDILKTSC